MKLVTLTYLAVVLCAISTPPSAAASDTRAALVDSVKPAYPPAGGDKEGAVILRFTVNADGTVADARVEQSDPPGIFDASAIAAVTAWRYKPRLVDGVAVAQPNTRIRLLIKPPPSARVIKAQKPFYPPEAFQKGLEGTVRLSLDIDSAGMPEHVMVLDDVAGGAFDKAALDSVKDWMFEAPVVEGKPQEVENVVVSVPFTLATADLRPVQISRKLPQYSANAIHQGLDGLCLVDYTIADDGSVTDAHAVYSRPQGTFERPTVDAVSTWRFQPPGAPAAHVRRNMEELFRFTMEESGPSLLPPGEWVRIRYTLTRAGKTEDVRIESQSAPDVRTSSALEQVRHAQFPPSTGGGAPVEKKDQLVTIYGSRD